VEAQGTQAAQYCPWGSSVHESPNNSHAKLQSRIIKRSANFEKKKTFSHHWGAYDAPQIPTVGWGRASPSDRTPSAPFDHHAFGAQRGQAPSNIFSKSAPDAAVLKKWLLELKSTIAI